MPFSVDGYLIPAYFSVQIIVGQMYLSPGNEKPSYGFPE